MSDVVRVYEIIDVDKERADEILDYVEHLIFETSMDITEVPKAILEHYTDPKDTFLAGIVYGIVKEFINNKVYKG